VRRYCAANRLNVMGTLTYAGSGEHDPKQVRRDVAVWFRSLRSALGGRPLPYVWVPEWHKTDHGLHLHFAVDRYVNYRLIRSTWGHGNIWIRRHTDLPVGSTTLTEARRAARYLSKYVTKSFDADESSRAAALHRYDVAQGFQPPVMRIPARSVEDGLESMCSIMRAAPSFAWSSREVEDWQAPPAVHFQWG